MPIVKLRDKQGKAYDVETKLKEVIIDKPVFKDKIIEIIQYDEITKETTKYIVEEKPTIKYNAKEERTTKFVPVEVPCEKPVIKEKTYEVPTKGALQTIRESIDLIVKTIHLLPDLINSLTAITKCAEEIPEMTVRFQEMRDMIKGYEKPVFKERIVYNAVIKDIEVLNAVPRDVEVINAIIRNKPVTVEELRKEQKRKK